MDIIYELLGEQRGSGHNGLMMGKTSKYGNN